jgi:hypothetical protein
MRISTEDQDQVQVQGRLAKVGAVKFDATREHSLSSSVTVLDRDAARQSHLVEEPTVLVRLSGQQTKRAESWGSGVATFFYEISLTLSRDPEVAIPACSLLRWISRLYQPFSCVLPPPPIDPFLGGGRARREISQQGCTEHSDLSKFSEAQNRSEVKLIPLISRCFESFHAKCPHSILWHPFSIQREIALVFQSGQNDFSVRPIWPGRDAFFSGRGPHSNLRVPFSAISMRPKFSSALQVKSTLSFILLKSDSTCIRDYGS